MKYKILQIQLTDAEIDMVNEGVQVRKHVLKTHMFGKNVVENVKKALAADYYDHVMNIEAYDLDSVFAIGNGMMEAYAGEVERVHEYCSSISVGDIIINEHDEKFVVDTFGFQVLPNKIAA